MLDGACYALLGYLFQLLGTASVCVREVVPGDDAWADLVARVGDGEVRCEEFGQDAVVRPLGLPDQGVTAIQFKYSATPGKRISISELIEILSAFDSSTREATARGVRISHYALISNRTLNASAQQLANDARSSPDPPGVLRLQTTQRGKPIDKNVSLLAPYSGKVHEAAKAWHAVLQALEIPPGATFEGDLARLRHFAARYGVLDREWEARLSALIGALVTETAGRKHVEVTHEWLKGQLAGDPNAANLQFGSKYSPHISILCRTRLDDQAPVRHRIPLDFFVQRHALQVIRDQISLNPVVFVYGDGGCGKSLAVEEYLRSVCDRQLVWSESALNATESGIVDAINHVRSPSCRAGVPDRSFSEVRGRLDIANPTMHPLMTIDLDGVDEAPDRRAEIHQLINLCWAGGRYEESPASLIVTCRSPAAGAFARDKLVSDWIGTPEPDLVRGVGFVPVEEFVDQELRQAAELLNGRPERRIFDALDAHQPSSRSSRFPDSKPISADVLHALKHPVVWGGYASLAEESDRDGVLDGTLANLAVLAQQLLRRFLLRCCSRRKWSDSDKLDKALCAAARFFNGLPPYVGEKWEHGCAGFLSPIEARMLYSESLSYGIVRREAGTAWRWGHRFVVDYLVNQPDPRAL